MDINLLVNLTARAWSLDILAQLQAGVPGRQAPLLAATGAGRGAFRASLEHLVDLHLLERNPGHGHPLRPEFRLTDAGADAAKMAARIVAVVPDGDTSSLVRRRWTVPVLALTERPQRFSAIRLQLTPITDRALSTSLGQLEARHWVQRDIDTTTRRPFPVYRATHQGRDIAQAVAISSVV